MFINFLSNLDFVGIINSIYVLNELTINCAINISVNHLNDVQGV